jgi:two-component system, OmpR family, sensor histidine kinase KdpD
MAQRRDPEQRPSPEALLEAARREDSRVGRLKIFVGAAPGVGKTYEMLQSAHARLKAGADVVVGVVETHGRAETQALLNGLEVLPRKRIEYKDQVIEEMDLDALIARHPQLALVDELAHTNAPGSRHPKRYLDVEELLSRGIDVYTAVNIQHIESLNDVVAQITHVRVRETVPDSVFDRADAIELIDLTPDDLIQRLKEGKVYVPKQAERALEHYFSPGNLTALRELALRRTAERVDEQLLTHMQANAIAGPWAAGERILVCVSEDPRAAGLVRYTKRLADRLHAQWTAISIETRRTLQLSDEERDRLADTLRLAEALGAEAITIPGVGRRIADDLISFAQANNVTQIIIGKSSRSWWFELTRGSVVHDLVRRAGNISVNVIAGEELAADPVPKKTVRTAERPEPFNPRPYLMALVIVAIGLGAGALIQPIFGIENVDLVFLTAVVGVAVRYGLWPSILASVAASLCYNFFFLPPIYTFTITDPTNVRLRDRPGADHRIAVRVQSQARRHRDARRRVVGDRLPDRADAEGAGGAAVARRRRADGEGGIPARGRTGQGRSCRRQLGLGQRPLGGARLGYAARRQAAVPADADRARADRRHRHRRRQDRAALDAGPAPPARRADGPGRARDRAGAASRGHGSRQAHRGIRPPALGAIDLDLA